MKNQGLSIFIMQEKDYIIAVITHCLFKNRREDSKYNVKMSTDYTLRDHYNAEWAIITFMSAKVMSNAPQWLQYALHCYEIVYPS